MSAFKSGYVAILGKPNVGKSTLMNRLIGEPLSIVHSRPGTTRHKILGILNLPEAQIIFVDTPGLQDSRISLDKFMIQEAKSSLDEADVVLLLTDVKSGFQEWDRRALQWLKGMTQPILFIMNKSDTVGKPQILPLIEEATKLSSFQEIIPISALKGDGLADLQKVILKYLPEGQPYYENTQLTDRPERFFVSEIIREKALESLRKEVPYAVAVQIEEMKERTEKNMFYIKAMLFVEKESQKAILIGKKGQMLKKIGQESRAKIENLLGKKVFLELWAKVLKNWRRDERALRELGYGASLSL
ncbi:MAG: GTPase Era [Chlamydiae bacterium]|nr:GTPase Era [Chlamydiota bacterium]MBI3266779.1 GTPase Era [Chlamydiota bacterium]